MSDQKSKMPDLNELGRFASKLFKDIKSSVTEIVEDYKAKREDTASTNQEPAEKIKPEVKEKPIKPVVPESEKHSEEPVTPVIHTDLETKPEESITPKVNEEQQPPSPKK